ncbi:hypothetical protein ACJ2_28040 [Pantoea sp. QMID2]|nr:hypothetical protein ACJ1_27120 [Pantoea sp. QMID1]GME42946.1 hypothetical protein ACJ3_31640 [Pantoea sp. QMID3]GME56668.1 hypothetical protein ACJ4_23620 [Pantoea sp. QMID4]GME59213.1 hypothetical protein ACJ2_28040 [Pantoea sp. QMID2]
MGSVSVGEYQGLSQAAGVKYLLRRLAAGTNRDGGFKIPDWLRSAVRQTSSFLSVTYQSAAGALTRTAGYR